MSARDGSVIDTVAHARAAKGRAASRRMCPDG